MPDGERGEGRCRVVERRARQERERAAVRNELGLGETTAARYIYYGPPTGKSNGREERGGGINGWEWEEPCRLI